MYYKWEFKKPEIDYQPVTKQTEPNNPIYAQKYFILGCFFLDCDDLAASWVKDYEYVERILNDNEIQGKYSNRVGAHVESIIKNRLENYRINENPKLQYEIQKEFPLLNKNIDFLIPNVNLPIILIESSYNITTGSGQSKRADQLVDFYGTLMRHNANHRANRILILN